MMALSHNLGFPRIGNRRQLKFALESYWKGQSDAGELDTIARQTRKAVRQYQQGLDLQPAGDFSFYDQVLDTSALLGVIPARFGQDDKEPVSLDTYFRVARGRAPTGEDTFASEMTKWFDTNYHYLVPEITADQAFRLASTKLFDEVQEAREEGIAVKPVLLGPVTWLYLAKVKGEEFDRLSLLPRLLDAYRQILAKLAAQGVEWLQIDEPLLVLDLAPEWQQAVTQAYAELAQAELKLLLTTYFAPLADNLALVSALPVAGLHVDAVLGDSLDTIAAAWPQGKVLSVGIVNGRNVWANDLRASLNKLKPLAERYGDKLWIAPSCSLLHSPVDLDSEDQLDQELTSWLAFAAQKVQEVIILTRGINQGEQAIAAELAASDARVASRQTSRRIHNEAVKARVAAIKAGDDRRGAPYAERARAQAARLQLPLFPTTTIGSFPQTADIRGLRRDHKAGSLDEQAYEAGIQQHIRQAIDEQQALGLDVFVHGEAERNDMVEYFGELLEGFAFTRFGWVQSYGSRCVKPPIIFGDVWRAKPMTVSWTRYAQSLTDKPVKGMLTGPVTILSWSFPREDESDLNSAYQIALALRDEVADLEAAGVGIIQIDEPAFRELMPLRKAPQAAYLAWAEKAFRLSAAVVENTTQIHTHMCYSEFNEIIESIARLDADVITIETSRSDMELLDVFRDFAYPNEIGPGVYDIHSPRIPSVQEMVKLIEKAVERLPKERIWVNPDCGLKTRNWEETRAALANMVAASEALRRAYAETRV
ncbi:5-methyltetrahydropteroyltriglutamate--homocysteine S-methyltransferase [Zobellella sp. CGMCC 1.18722]|uniref:5-methyltetrahydropteroyltriglutamate--homocysteine methyltransferase n=2 Tax=Zobellella iuensis TaxID=2803811 RepID=A0ABS1QWB3_9GAMM|nr:5-methyltetrahydropteroyltriglutamate--homocysteine S-methyltransferase [Zobellella iuensis]